MKTDKNFKLEESYEISPNDAAWLVYNFMKQPALCEIGSKEAIGGIIEKSTLMDPNKEDMLPFKGTMAWFCRNEDPNLELPKCFLAFEQGEYRPERVPGRPKKKTLLYSDKIILCDKPQITEKDILDLILDSNPVHKSEDKEIDVDTVRKLRTKFGKDPRGRKFNRYYCSFFENEGVINEEVKNLVKNADVEYIKYFFGYDNSHKKYFSSNRIRLILMGYNSNGLLFKNIDFREKSGLILQNSWPPPPPNTEEQT
ncbi:hypothetical protein [Aquiflexum lacus]|uniref:hypothetical protein n=1 Tax=Aquiflexum lacus TaxID=2483805 RepID=UPI001895B78E|nr:hypothetical protein [Aquiflexum lacus]